MKRILIIFSSVDGHTENICKRISEHMTEHSQVEIAPLKKAYEKNINDFDQVIIGASIRYGNYRKELFKFIDKNLELLSQKENAFFSVNVVARKEEKNRNDTNPYIEKFLQKTEWKPKIIDVFAGVVDYPSYRFIDKFMIRLIMYITRGPTDTRKKYEFTNWKRVKEFSDQLLCKLI